MFLEKSVKDKNYSITLMICYFGNFPTWFNIFLETCKHNSTVRFIIFTDNKVQCSNLPNVTYKNFSLDKFNSLASEKLGLSINISKPYKLCDFKPAYGIIFEDYLKDADFWGHCDVDLIFGDIRSFITSRILSKYDVITARKEYVVGHFTLYRNTNIVNRMYEQSKDHQLVFQDQRTFSFDECNFLWWYLLNGYNILNIQSPIESMSHVIRKLSKNKIIKVYFDNMMLEQEIIDPYGRKGEFQPKVSWKEGKLINIITGKKLLYFHFHFLKKCKDFDIPDWAGIPSKFMVSRKGFVS